MDTALRPMNTGELLDRTFFLYRRHFVLFVGIAVFPNFVTLMLQLAILNLKPSTVQDIMVSLVVFVVTLLISMLVTAASQAVTIVAVSDVQMGKAPSIAAAFAGMKDCLAKIILVTVVVSIGIVFGLLFCIVPGILLALAWSLAVPAAVVEKLGPLDAIPRSCALTKGSRGSIFVIMLLVGVITIIVTVCFAIPVLFAAGFSQMLNPKGLSTGMNALRVILNFLGSTLVTPISAIATSLIYYNQRTRKEGFDLQLMMSSMESTPQNPPDIPAVS
jgi:hypothetical protein